MGFEVRRRLREPSERKALSRHDVWHPVSIYGAVFGAPSGVAFAHKAEMRGRMRQQIDR